MFPRFPMAVVQVTRPLAYNQYRCETLRQWTSSLICNTLNETKCVRFSSHRFSSVIMCSLSPSHPCQRQEGSGCIYPESFRERWPRACFPYRLSCASTVLNQRWVLSANALFQGGRSRQEIFQIPIHQKRS